MEQPDFEYPGLIPLTDVRCGVSVRLHSLQMDPAQAARLREMGLCEGRCLSIIRSGERLIVGCGGCRIGLHRDLARGLMSEAVEAPDVQPRSKPSLSLRRILRKFN